LRSAQIIWPASRVRNGRSDSQLLPAAILHDEARPDVLDRPGRREAAGGVVAMLLRCDYDHARTRRHLFGDCRQFWAKVVLTRRIKWFEDYSNGSPSFNHAWFIWNWQHNGGPTLHYEPR
jgi:hypothetical protein